MKNERDNIVNINEKRTNTPKYRKHGYYEEPIANRKADALSEKEEWDATWGENKELNTTNKIVLVVLSLLIIGSGFYTLI